MIDTPVINHMEIQKAEGCLVVDLFEGEHLQKQIIKHGMNFKVTLSELSRHGWSVRLNHDETTATALRGEPTRIDIEMRYKTLGVVTMYPDGWTASSFPMKKFEKDPVSIEEERVSLEEDGWTVMTWDWNGRTGLRAWRGDPLPVRATWQIIDLRNRLEGLLTITQADRFELKRLNLAFVL